MDSGQHKMMTGATAGLIAGSKIGLVSGLCGLALNRFVPPFRSLRISAKVAICFTPALFSFAYAAERGAHYAGRKLNEENLQRYFDDRNKAPSEFHEPHKRLALWKSAANGIYNNPFKTIVGFGVPAVAAVYFTRDADISNTQRFFHTRVLGQMLVLGIIISTVGVYGFMTKRGGNYTD